MEVSLHDEIVRYCTHELYRLHDAHRRTALILYELADSAHQSLLATTLREQVAVNTWCMEKLEQAFGHLGVELVEIPNSEVAVMVLEASAEEEAPTDAVRDMMIAQSAIRLEHYSLANYTGLTSWFRQVGRHDVATLIDLIIHRLTLAEHHLEALRPGLTDLHTGEGRRNYRTPAVARPRQREPGSDLDGYERG